MAVIRESSQGIFGVHRCGTDADGRPDLDLGDGLMLSLPTEDLLAPGDRTVSLPYGLLKSGANLPKDDGSLDFDLSDSAALLAAKLPKIKK